MQSTTKERQPATIQASTAELISRLSAPESAARDEEIRIKNEEAANRQAAIRRSQAITSLAGMLGDRYKPSRCSLDSFKVSRPKQREAIDRLTGFDVLSGKNLILYGTVGTGKDHLLAAMLYRVCRETPIVQNDQQPAGWINGPELFGRFRDSFDNDTKEEAILHRFIRPAVLGISDPVPQVGDATSWRTEILYRIIDMRYRAMKATWLTINASSESDADVKLTAPVFDRLRDGAEMIPCFWPSFRESAK